jgi:hypothetical protein
MNLYKNYFLLLTTSFGLIACGPQNYDDCVLDHSKGVNDEFVMTGIMASCSSKFKEQKATKKCELREMSEEEKSKVQFSSASISDMPYASFNVYNGNEKSSVEEITVNIIAGNFPNGQQYDLYISYPIGPKSANDAGIKIAAKPTTAWNYSIVSLRTCK